MSFGWWGGAAESASPPSGSLLGTPVAVAGGQASDNAGSAVAACTGLTSGHRLYVAIAAVNSSSAVTKPTISDTQSLTWSEVARNAVLINYVRWDMVVYSAVTNGVNTTITGTSAGAAVRMQVVSYSGAGSPSTNTGTGSDQTNNAVSATVSPYAAGSGALGFFANWNQGDITVPSGFTELADFTLGGADPASLQTIYDNTSPSTTAAWTMSFYAVVILLEVPAAPSATTYNESMALAAQAGLTDLSVLTTAGSLPLGAQAGTTKASILATAGSVSLGVSAGLAEASALTTAGALSLALSAGVSNDGGEPPPSISQLVDQWVSSTNVQDSAGTSPPVLFGDIDESPDTPDATWWSVTNSALDAEVLLGFQTPGGAIIGTQTFRVYVKRRVAGVSDNLTLSLYESGVLVRALGTTTITSDAGQLVTATWDAGEITSAANVQVKIAVASSSVPSSMNFSIPGNSMYVPLI